jgi:hypothetical protein
LKVKSTDPKKLGGPLLRKVGGFKIEVVPGVVLNG